MLPPHGSWSTPPVRILIGDRHTLFRAALRKLLETQPGFEVVAELDDALLGCPPPLPDPPIVAVLDAQMPGGAIAIARLLRLQSAENRVLLYNLTAKDPAVTAALEAGVTGLFDRAGDGNSLVAAIRSVAADEYVASPSLARHLAGVGRAYQPGGWGATAAADGLTDRELDVLRLVAVGRSNREIGISLRMSENTVRAHLRTIFRKLGARNRVHAVSEAVRHGALDEVAYADIESAAARSDL